MTRLLPPITLLALLVALLALLLLWREKRANRAVPSDLPQDRDLFNMQGYEDRKKQFRSEDRLEKR